MMSKSDLPSNQTLLVAGAGAALALLVAFTAIVDDAVKTGPQRLLSADVGGRAAPSARAVPADAAPLQALPTERRAGPSR